VPFELAGGIEMLKLYRPNDGFIEYVECWMNNGDGVKHVGIVGDRGEIFNSSDITDSQAYENSIKREYTPQGYSEWPDNLYCWIVAQIPIKTIEKGRLLIEPIMDAMNNDLGWLGVGHMDGYDIGWSLRPEGKELVLNFFAVVVEKNIGCTTLRQTMRSKTKQKHYDIGYRPFDVDEYTLFESTRGREDFCP